MSQYGHCDGAALLLLCNHWHGDICFIHTTAKELLHVSIQYLVSVSEDDYGTVLCRIGA